VLRALEKKLRLPNSRVLIFGAGGSARAAAFALAKAGAEVMIAPGANQPRANLHEGAARRPSRENISVSPF